MFNTISAMFVHNSREENNLHKSNIIKERLLPATLQTNRTVCAFINVLSVKLVIQVVCVYVYIRCF